MGKRVLVVEGHPDQRAARFLHALADAYAEGAATGLHQLRVIRVGALDFPLLRTTEEFHSGEPPATLRSCQEDLAWAEHVVILFPLWLGGLPALLKGFFEQMLRPGFAFSEPGAERSFRKLLKGRSVRLIVTMGMPAAVYRWYFGAHGVRSFAAGALAFCGFSPIRCSYIGNVEGMSQRARENWLQQMQSLGKRAG